MTYTVTYSGPLKPQTEAEEYSYEEARLDAIIIQTEGDLTDEDRDEISEQFTYGQCYCEHDCCGHRYSTGPSIKKIGDNEYLVLVYSARNV